MTTSHSPLSRLKAQAASVAKDIKAMERGEPSGNLSTEQVAALRGQPTTKIGIVMDDKVVTIELPWSKVHEAGGVALAEYILKLMKGQANAPTH